MNRTETRNVAFEFLYTLEIQKIHAEEFPEQIDLFLQSKEIEEEKVKKYIQDVTKGIEEHKEQILTYISTNLKEKWEIGRISKVNVALLKLATYEMVYNQLPYKVVINEVIELAKKYGDDNSPSFINGVLANIVKQLNLKSEE